MSKLKMSQEKLEQTNSKLSVAPDGSKFINPEVQKIRLFFKQILQITLDKKQKLSYT